MSDPIIVVQHLWHIYGTGSTQKIALKDISLEIKPGRCVAVVGFNGSGKSTLVQHFNGLLRPTQGRVVVDGFDVGDKRLDLRRLRQRVGMLFQFPETQLFEPTVYDDVAFGPRRMRLRRSEVRARVMAALDIVGLPHRDYARRSPFDLSGGQRRRVALAGVLAMSPSILILDEPSVGLDAEARAEFYSYIQRVQQERGTTIVLVSHDMSEVVALADWLYVMYDGSLVMQGTPRDVFQDNEQLRSWKLAPPPLSKLLNVLRQKGIDVPAHILTLDEAFLWLHEHLRMQLPVDRSPGL